MHGSADRADAVAAHAGLDLRGGGVIALAQELHAPGFGVEDRAFGKAAARPARAVYRAGIQHPAAVIDFMECLLMLVAENGKPRLRVRAVVLEDDAAFDGASRWQGLQPCNARLAQHLARAPERIGGAIGTSRRRHRADADEVVVAG